MLRPDRESVLTDIGTMWPNPDAEILPLGANHDIWRLTHPEQFSGLSWTEIATMLANEGAKAGNAHNKQPWSIESDEQNNTLTVHVRPEAIGTPSDSKGRQAHLGVGCFAENVALAQIAYGLVPNVQIVEETTETETRVGVRFTFSDLQQGVLKIPYLLTLINARRSYRGPFERGVKIPDDVKETIFQASEMEGLTASIIDSPLLKNTVARLQATANDYVLSHADFRRDLGNHLVPNDSPATRAMTGRTFGLLDDTAQKIHDALLTEGPFPGTYAAGFTQSIRDATMNCAAIGVISAPQNTPEYWIRSGMLLERLWLYAQSRGLGVWITAGLVEAHELYLSNFMNILKIHSTPTAMFLMGKPRKETWPHAPRELIHPEDL